VCVRERVCVFVERSIMTLLGLVMCGGGGGREGGREGGRVCASMCVCVCGTGYRVSFGAGDVCGWGQEREGGRGDLCVRERQCVCVERALVTPSGLVVCERERWEERE